MQIHWNETVVQVLKNIPKSKLSEENYQQISWSQQKESSSGPKGGVDLS
jgi:hypothetical protein